MLGTWNDGAAKSAIVDFVARVTRTGGADFVPPADRVAVFDNDGTLWCEQPFQVQLFFLADRVRELAGRDPGLRNRQPFQAVLERDVHSLHALGKEALQELYTATHSGMDQDEFARIAGEWLARAKHPAYGRLFTDGVYEPQLELLALLRANDFKVWIVSGGGVDFIRAFAEESYGIPRERVVGSSEKLVYRVDGERVTLVKQAALDSFDDREAKPQNIGLHIGRRPILAFGNSDGDLAMMRYCLAGSGARLALLLHHDDGEREVAYDRQFALSPLTEALDGARDFGITVVSMKRDWKTVFGARAS